VAEWLGTSRYTTAIAAPTVGEITGTRSSPENFMPLFCGFLWLLLLLVVAVQGARIACCVGHCYSLLLLLVVVLLLMAVVMRRGH
jgi:hypothetical protein